MKERIITSFVLLAILGLVLISGTLGFSVFVTCVGLIAAYEIYKIKADTWKPIIFVILVLQILLGGFLSEYVVAVLAITLILYLALAVFNEWFTVESLAFVFMMGTIVSLFVESLLLVFSFDIYVMLYVALATYATDICAYFGGTFFGKTKLIERVSPKKTVEGAIIGVVGSFIVSFIFGLFFVVNRGLLPIGAVIVLSSVIPFVGQVGDLAFSLIKRYYDIKDYGNLLPGHGGILDRIDSIAFSFIVFSIVLSVVH